jgi:uncharacterized membrane protein YhaH (DUF805 family)
MQRQVTFGEAIQLGLKKYATFDGRASRSEFWWFILFTALVSAIVGVFHSDALTSLVSIILLLPSLAIGARRLHDTGRSGWWLIIAITVIGYIVLIIFWADESKGANQYGDVPNTID